MLVEAFITHEGRHMAAEMKVDAKVIKALREERAWSQEYLASIAGPSARAIQRQEADGNASLESKMAIVAAFGVEPAAGARGGADARERPFCRCRPTVSGDHPDRIWVAILLMLVVMAGYHVGADLAHRDNRISGKCAASPAACKTAAM